MKFLFVKLYVFIRKFLIGSGIGKFKVVEILNDFLLSYMKRDYVVIFGNKMFLDKYDALELSLNGIYEPEETNLIKKLVRPGDVVLDIGAHIGYYTLIFSDLVGENGKVIAFEPDVTNFALLKKNVEINNCHNVILENVAVSDKIGQSKLFDVGVSSNPTISNVENTKFTVINSISLDEYFKNFGEKINFIKMDIEGAEYSVLIGANNLLTNNEDVKIISEFYPVALNLADVTSNNYINLLSIIYKFILYKIDEKNKIVSFIDPALLLQDYTVDNKQLTNLLCVRNEVDLCINQ